MMRTPSVSVVIPAYRVTQFIRASLDSVFRQTYTDFEVLVVNDGCPDTPALEVELEPYQSRITYLKHLQNAGPSAARNTAIRASKGEFIAFLDGDDEWEAEYLHEQMRILSEHPSADVVYCDAWLVGDPLTDGRRFMEYCPTHGEVTVQKLFSQTATVMVSALIRKNALLRVGMMDPSIRCSEDLDLWVRIVQSGGRIVYQGKPLVRYRRRPGNASSNFINMQRGAVAVAEKALNRGGNRDDLATIRQARDRWKAAANLAEGRAHFKRGEFRSAANCLGEANEYMRRPQLTLAVFAVRSALWLLRPLTYFADR